MHIFLLLMALMLPCLWGVSFCFLFFFEVLSQVSFPALYERLFAFGSNSFQMLKCCPCLFKLVPRRATWITLCVSSRKGPFMSRLGPLGSCRLPYPTHNSLPCQLTAAVKDFTRAFFKKSVPKGPFFIGFSCSPFHQESLLFSCRNGG